MTLIRTLVAATVPAAGTACVGDRRSESGRGGWHGGHWHGGCCYGGYWPGAFWGGVGLGIGIGAVGYYGAYYPGYYYGPGWSTYYYDAPVGGAVYSTVDPASRSGQPVPQTSQAPEPIFYPRNGQTAETTEHDRRECNRWATTQRGAMNDSTIFQRATFACMEGRGYTVK